MLSRGLVLKDKICPWLCGLWPGTLPPTLWLLIVLVHLDVVRPSDAVISHTAGNCDNRVWLITASDRIELHRTMSEHFCKREIVISKALHILTINCVIICPPLVLDILNFIVGADRRAERAENRVERSESLQWAGVAGKRWSGAERGARDRGAGSRAYNTGPYAKEGLRGL